MAVIKIKTLTVGENVYTFDADEATEYSAGFMSSDDKEKLNDIAEGATANEGTVKSVVAGTGLTGGTITESGTIALAASGATAGNYGPSNNVTGNEGTTISIPFITVDAYGRVTAIVNKTFTAKNTTYGPATQQAAGLMSAEDKAKLDALTSITSDEISSIFSSMTADPNPNIYDLTAITSDEINSIFGDY